MMFCAINATAFMFALSHRRFAPIPLKCNWKDSKTCSLNIIFLRKSYMS